MVCIPPKREPFVSHHEELFQRTNCPSLRAIVSWTSFHCPSAAPVEGNGVHLKMDFGSRIPCPDDCRLPVPKDCHFASRPLGPCRGFYISNPSLQSSEAALSSPYPNP